MNLSAEQASAITAREITYSTSRSGGKGGQHVNKVETQVDAEFDLSLSGALTQEQAERIAAKHGGKVIRARSNRYRSQARNKEDAAEKILLLLEKYLKVVPRRRPTRPGKAAKERKLKEKKRRSERKELRRKPF